MIESISIYFLHAACLIVLYTFILGFEPNRNRIFFKIGIVVIFAGLLLRLCPQEFIGRIVALYVIPNILVVTPVILFEGKRSNIFLISLNLKLWLSCSSSMLLAIFNYKGLFVIVVNHLILLLALLTAAYLLRKNRLNSIQESEELRSSLLMAITVILFIFSYKAGYNGEPDMEMIEHVVNRVNILTGLLAILSIAGVCMLQTLIIQKSELEKLLILNEQCIDEQCMQYNMLLKKDQQLKEFRHEYKSNIAAMKTYADNKNYELLSEYINQLEERNDFTTKIVHTGNQIIDAILNKYIDLGKEDNIAVASIGTVPANMPMKPIDINAIVNNVVSNAYEAALKCNGYRFIQIEFMNDDEYMYIKTKNSSLDISTLIEGKMQTTKADTEMHGFGVKIIKDTVKKYGGQVHWNYAEGTMVTHICIPVK